MIAKSDVLQMLQQGEGQAAEFKETTGATKEAIKTLAAFGSQATGGCVIFGVHDDGTPNKAFALGDSTGPRLAGSIKANTMSMVTGSPLIPDIFRFDEPSLLVVRVTARHAQDGPYVAYGYRYRRSGASTHKVEIDVNWQGPT